MSPATARTRLGAAGERIACAHLERAGYELVERNCRCGRIGEIDVVARRDGCLVFCEVKTRRAGTVGGPAGPLDAIGPAKRLRLRRLAAEWLRTRDLPEPRPAAIRFDAIGIVVDGRGQLLSLDHVENAF